MLMILINLQLQRLLLQMHFNTIIAPGEQDNAHELEDRQ